jgi:hypothetical protein
MHKDWTHCRKEQPPEDSLAAGCGKLPLRNENFFGGAMRSLHGSIVLRGYCASAA